MRAMHRLDPGALQDARLDAGLTVADLASQVGVSPQTIYRWLRMASGVADATLLRLAAALGVDAVDLLADDN